MIALAGATAPGASALGAAGATSGSAWGSGEDFGRAMSASADAGHGLATTGSSSSAGSRRSGDAAPAGSTPGSASGSADGTVGARRGTASSRSSATADDGVADERTRRDALPPSLARSSIFDALSQRGGRGSGDPREDRPDSAGPDALPTTVVPALRRLLAGAAGAAGASGAPGATGAPTFSIRIDAGHLGEVRATATLGPTGVRVELLATTASAARELAGSTALLREQLAPTSGAPLSVEIGVEAA